MHTPTAKLIIARMRAEADALKKMANQDETMNPMIAMAHHQGAHALGHSADDLLAELQDPKAPTVEAMEMPNGGLLVETTPKIDAPTAERLREFMLAPPMLPGRCRCVVAPICPECYGVGHKDGETCYRCEGQG